MINLAHRCRWLFWWVDWKWRTGKRKNKK